MHVEMHILNLKEVCDAKKIQLNIDAVRYSDRELDGNIRDLIRDEIRDVNSISMFYDVIFITDETGTHYRNMVSLKDKTKHMFIEKPIFDDIVYDG